MHQLTSEPETSKLKPGVCIVSPFPPPYGGMAVQAQKLTDLLKESGFEVIPVRTNADLPRIIAKIPFFRTFVNLLVLLRNLHRALRRTDTVFFLTGFLNFFLWVTYPAILWIRLLGGRVILNARGGGAGVLFEKYGRLIKIALDRTERIVTPSGYLRDAFRRAYDMEPMIIPNIADLDQFRFRERREFRPRLLVARSLEAMYDIGCVIRAFERVHRRYPDAALGIAGKGSRMAELKALASRLGLEKSIHFYGEVHHEEIQQLYKEYDIMINASRVDNLPGVILEAFACGLPVVSTNAGGIPYMVEDGETGLLADVGDCGGLAQKVIDVVEDPELGRGLAAAGLQESRRYSWDQVKQRLIPLLLKRDGGNT